MEPSTIILENTTGGRDDAVSPLRLGEPMMRPSLKRAMLTAAFAIMAVAGRSFVNAQQKSLPPHVVLTSQEDRQRMMDLLKITMFPGGPGAYLASTYDEKTANPYPNLPDPLTFINGSKVKSSADWWKRRAEILELFDRDVYGRRPK